MQAIKDMLGSERALLVVVLIAAVTVLAGMGIMTVAEWQAYTKDLAFVFIGSKTVTTAIEAFKAPTSTVTSKMTAADDRVVEVVSTSVSTVPSGPKPGA